MNFKKEIWSFLLLIKEKLVIYIDLLGVMNFRKEKYNDYKNI